MSSAHHTLKSTYADRSLSAGHPLLKYLFSLMDLKASNLCLSADVSTARDLLYLADTIGPSIVVLKTHHDIISGWDYSPNIGTGAKLASLARKHGFLIFEDRKFGDIGNTVQLQYTAGAARIIEWAHIVNVNMVPGKLSVASLTEAANKWRDRHPYEVKTTVSVGTPRSDAFDEDEEDPHSNRFIDDDDNVPPHVITTAPAPNGNLSPTTSGSGNALFGTFRPDLDGRPSFLPGDGRKGSIVSVTTVTQHYEPVDSPRITKNLSGDDEELFPGIEEAPNDRGLLILAQMSSQGNFMTPEYTQACIEAAREYKSFVMGYVAQSPLNSLPEDDFITMSPGCQLPPASQENDDVRDAVGGDGKGQQYNTPAKLICQSGADIIIVGRGIIKADDPQTEADRYRRAGWKAYLQRLSWLADQDERTQWEREEKEGKKLDDMDVDLAADEDSEDDSPHGTKRKRSVGGPVVKVTEAEK